MSKFISTRPLTELEQQFVKEAEAHYFAVMYNQDGEPYAMGAKRTGSVFTMDVTELDDGDGSVYMLDSDE